MCGYTSVKSMLTILVASVTGVNNFRRTVFHSAAHSSSAVAPGMLAYVGYEFTKLYKLDFYESVYRFKLKWSEIHSFSLRDQCKISPRAPRLPAYA